MKLTETVDVNEAEICDVVEPVPNFSFMGQGSDVGGGGVGGRGGGQARRIRAFTAAEVNNSPAPPRQQTTILLLRGPDNEACNPSKSMTV
ncbi:hypothetical protein ElyMa_000538400 [Elysia marginata]|uniref:Uncharacterized protein n=1 Tax=Elysia marginata TaxID=1093978 RepID=A0AAV4FYZ8_9GAST|nr:hypothetical protein ElyMa_000538400 [Elysia marginata]